MGRKMVVEESLELRVFNRWWPERSLTARGGKYMAAASCVVVGHAPYHYELDPLG